jgi:serine/threonine protein kinase/tetratricopeptide (TPR) repeat protein
MSRDQIPISDFADVATPEDAEVARVLDVYLAELEAGRLADPNRLLAEHPAIADQLRDCLDVMHLAGRMTSDLGAAPAPDDHATLGPQLDDYRIVCQVGRGGMGIVYEAEQQSLRRRVALKVLPLAAAIDPRQLRRFHVEAQAAAQLHHTNIVPVYAVGCERGVHYYAMQYIEGKSLADVVRELRQLEGRDGAEQRPTVTLDGDLNLASMLASGQLQPPEKPPVLNSPTAIQEIRPPTPVSRTSARATPTSSSSTRTSAYFRTVASLGIQAAEALEHAHQEGVVHRDIKPANLMVDVKGHLWIADFGLARLQNDASLTLSGDLLGTIRYMSPEQAIGHRAVVDQRTDVYSLGVTLYEMVALEPAFDGGDRREVLRRIIEEEPMPLRGRNSSVPRELETIIQKATAKEPESRYLTAQELADDLQRFLEHKPIGAKRPTLLERVAKWSRRHRMVVVAAFLVLLLAVGGLATGLVLIGRERDEARRQRLRAEENFAKARQVVDAYLTKISENRLILEPGLQPLRKELLEEALKFYNDFSRENAADPALRAELAQSYLRVGNVDALLGERSGARLSFGAAVVVFEDLVAAEPANPDHRLGLAHAHVGLGNMQGQSSDRELSARSYDDALAILSPLAETRPLVPRYLEALAEVRIRLGHCKEAIAVWEQLTTAHPESDAYQDGLAQALNGLGIQQNNAGDPKAAARSYEAAIAIRRQLAEGHPRTFSYLDTLAQSLNNMGIVYASEDGDRAIARQYFEQAVEIRRKLVAVNPGVSVYRVGLGRAYINLGHLQRLLMEPVAAIRSLEHAMAIYESLLEADPASALYAGVMANSEDELAWLLALYPDQRYRDPARAIKLAGKAIGRAPNDREYWATMGLARFRVGEWDGAIAALEKGPPERNGGNAADWIMAMAHWRRGEREQARIRFDKAVLWLDRNKPRDDDMLVLRAEAAALLGLNDRPVDARGAK